MNDYIYIYYLSYKNLFLPEQGWYAPMPRKERKRKEQSSEKMEEKYRIEAQRVKPYLNSDS